MSINKGRLCHYWQCHRLCQANTTNVDKRDAAFYRVTMAFNRWLADAEFEFFQLHPNYKGLVKVGKLTNQKRKFKCIFSIHAKPSFAAIPLNPKNIVIEFERAKLPLKPDVLAEGATWYDQYDVTEADRFGPVLAPYMIEVQKELDERKIRAGDFEVYRLHDALKIDEWPPCMKNILICIAPDKGPHRAMAVLVAYLYQIGWSREAALKVWEPLATKCGVEGRIFDVLWGQMNCPNCKTIQNKSSGYPEVGLGGLGYCEWNESCRGVRWPGNYGTKPTIKVTGDLPGMIREMLAVLENYNDPPIIFQRGGTLCWVQKTTKVSGFKT